MENLFNFSSDILDSYIKSFVNITTEQKKNFTVKKDHSYRVAEVIEKLALDMKLNEDDKRVLSEI